MKPRYPQLRASRVILHRKRAVVVFDWHHLSSIMKKRAAIPQAFVKSRTEAVRTFLRLEER